VVLEENMVEVFVNDRYTLAARIPERLPVRQIGLTGKGENIRFTDASIYWLKYLEEIV